MLLRVIVALIIVITCHQQTEARSVKPCVYWCPVLERVAEMGRADRGDAEWAFSFLRAAAENQPRQIDDASSRRVGLDKARVERAPFFDMEIRGVAFLLIATLPSELALPYLLSVTPDQFSDDGDRTYIYRQVRIALYKANSSRGQQRKNRHAIWVGYY